MLIFKIYRDFSTKYRRWVKITHGTLWLDTGKNLSQDTLKKETNNFPFTESHEKESREFYKISGHFLFPNGNFLPVI